MLNIYGAMTPVTVMMPGMGRVNPKQMKQAMKRMGITTDEINGVEEVIIRTKDKEYVITDAQVSIMTMQGQKTYQIVGETEVRGRTQAASGPAGPAPVEALPEEDVQLVMSQTGCDRDKAVAALKATDGQPAEAIIKIMSS
ncbi:MAG: Nascent polypeptide-associated complex protein [Methanomassiliicoccales archaeon PtaU1.Bin124]|nr:MAG: Nascent polypeptide-associated complex protein [Methanomassiliicoccales archaeon PtaU1.Bin124]